MDVNNEFDLTFDIILPTYNGSAWVSATIISIISQSFNNYRILIQDDASTDNTEDVIKSFKDQRIFFEKNTKNVGYSKNMEILRQKTIADIIYLMGQDDILGADALLNTYKVFKNNPEVGAVTRPYFWFNKDVSMPVRAKVQMNAYTDEIITMNDPQEKIIDVFSTLDQLSGLAFRREFVDMPFHEDIFPCHVYPFASIMKNHPVVMLKDYNVAVRIASSQCRFVSSIYNKSPILSWFELFENVFNDEKFNKFREGMIKKFVAINYVGLIQIRNYSTYKNLLREIYYLIKFRNKNLVDFRFWFFSLGTMLVPSIILIPMIEVFKNKINSLRLKGIKFKYECSYDWKG
ncbi:MAG: glycosyltransferase [Pseudomonadota bacterium]